MSNDTLQQRYGAVMMNAFGTPKRVFERGEGVHVWDADGKQYTDLLSGLAVLGLGHAHPRITDAVTAQLERLGHISNLFASQPQIRLAERLAAHLGDPVGESLLLELWLRGKRNRIQTHPSDRAHQDRRHARRLPRTHGGVARHHRE